MTDFESLVERLERAEQQRDVKAAASEANFNRMLPLEERLEEAEATIARLREELEDEKSDSTARLTMLERIVTVLEGAGYRPDEYGGDTDAVDAIKGLHSQNERMRGEMRLLSQSEQQAMDENERLREELEQAKDAESVAREQANEAEDAVSRLVNSLAHEKQSTALARKDYDEMVEVAANARSTLQRIREFVGDERYWHSTSLVLATNRTKLREMMGEDDGR